MTWLHTKEKIVLEAVNLLSQNGIHKLSTKDLSHNLDISESTVFKYFRTKNALLKAVLKQYSKFDEDLDETLTLESLEGYDALYYMFKMNFQYYENYPEISIIHINLNQLKYNHYLINSIVDIQKSRKTLYIKHIEIAIDKGDLDASILPEQYYLLILGGTNQLIEDWRESKYSYDLETSGLQLLKTLFLKEKEEVSKWRV